MSLPASAPANAGLRQWTQHNRSTGATIAVYDGIAAGMDTDAGRWQTVCETHGAIVSHQTLSLADDHSAVPDEWCESCAEIYRTRLYAKVVGD